LQKDSRSWGREEAGPSKNPENTGLKDWGDLTSRGKRVTRQLKMEQGQGLLRFLREEEGSGN